MSLHQATLRLFWTGNFFIIGLILLLNFWEQTLGQSTTGWVSLAYAALLIFCYAILFVLPGIGLSRLLLNRPASSQIFAVVYAGLLAFVLYSDTRIFSLFGFHINSFVWNLITTPGGFAAMDGSDSSYQDALLKIVIVFSGQIAWWFTARFWVQRAYTVAAFSLKPLLLCWVVALIGCQLLLGFGRLLEWPAVIHNAQKIPFLVNTQVDALASQIGIDVPTERHYLKPGPLNYPLTPLQSLPDSPSPNIIFLVSESLRADMLTADIMPNLWQFAQQANRFDNHFSGGNGTRMGVFSLFYGLSGHYWFSMLKAQQAPVLMQLLRERHYQFGLFTSSAFTYPEFDKTVFAGFSSDQLHEHNHQATWENDQHNVGKLVNFIDQAQTRQAPFFAFMFFNSPHARYQFPDSSIIRPDFLDDFNYVNRTAKGFQRDIVQIKNRYINSVHFLDTQLGRLIDHLEQQQLLTNTLLVITGDHAEEFMENGRWSHGSEIHNVQIHTPLVVWIPGKSAGVHQHPTSHVDVVPTLMPLLGVTTPAREFSDGMNLFVPDHSRYRTAGNWDKLARMDEQFKVVLPIGQGSLTGATFTTANDQPLPDEASQKAMLKQHISDWITELERFYR